MDNKDSMIGKRLDGRYELMELIGAGGMADIYKAKDITEDKIVAVKILKNEFAGSEDFLRRFRNESKAIALLSHPNIVKIFDVGFSEQIQFIVMEYIDGISLAEYIKLQGVLKWKDAVYFTVQILRALQHAHDRGIVHRDIKSQNVMMLPDGTIKVMDFGIARFNRETDKTLSEKTIGSVHYISPEQARGEMTDEKSDIYSVGVMLYEMLTGHKPFDGDTPVAIALQHMQTAPKMPREINSSIPEGLEEITIKAMQKEPSQRYQTAGEMINDIEEFKKDPSIVFEYKYFSTDGTTKYFDKVTDKTDNKIAPASVTEIDDEELYEDDDDEIEERKSPLLPILFAVASVFVIMTAWLIFKIVTGNIPTDSGHDDEAIMPNIIGKTYEQVQAEYPWMKLDIKREYSMEFEEYTIMEQLTPANRSIKKSHTVTIVISNGPKKINIEDLTNLNAEDAKRKLEKSDLKVKFIKAESDDIPEGYVIKTDPAAHSQVPQGTEVKVYVSLGKGEKVVNVPSFIGKTLDEAQKLADEKKLILKVIYGSSNEFEKGQIIKQNVDENSMVNQETEIEVTVCDGKAVVNETTIEFELPDFASDTGTFIFEYFKDGVRFNREERDMSMNAGNTVSFDVKGSEKVKYAVKITNVKDESLSGKLLEVEVDFTKEKPEQDVLVYKAELFKQLVYVAPETTTPEPPDTTPEPDTSIPDTSVPDTSAPDTSVPDTSEPDTSVPDTSEPDTSVPDTSEPDTSVPDTSAPDTSALDTSASDTSASDTSAPDTSAPEVE